VLEPKLLTAIDKLGDIAKARGQSMPQLALSWILRRKEITSALVGVRTLEQLKDNLGVLNNLELSEEEISTIDDVTKDVDPPNP
jgi:L-glyceraldehyde 3-phosphate reductase